jgi:hypothetical protein
MNQCDGCMQRAQKRGHLHVDKEGHAFMACQQDRYSASDERPQCQECGGSGLVDSSGFGDLDVCEDCGGTGGTGGVSNG